MTTIAIVPEKPNDASTSFRASAGKLHSTGRTPGEALDAISSQLGDSESNAVAVVLQMRPDRYFDEAQQTRLAGLMDRWRAARDSGSSLVPEEQAELDRLVAAELSGATQRATALLSGLQP
jgi:hypothetical protein